MENATFELTCGSKTLALARSQTPSTMPILYSDLADNGGHWPRVQPSLDHAAVLTVIGNATNTDFADSRLALTNLSTRVPTIIVFALAAEPD